MVDAMVAAVSEVVEEPVVTADVDDFGDLGVAVEPF